MAAMTSGANRPLDRTPVMQLGFNYVHVVLDELIRI